MPIAAKHAADVELHSMKCSCIEAMQSVHADASVAQEIAAPIKIQYRLSKFISS